jgi:hypothetical protein
MPRILTVVLLSALLSACAKTAPPITFLAKPYRLGSFSKKQNATWEYVSSGETVENWTTLLTLIDRPDAHTPPELDRLAEGVMATYKSHGGRILLAKTLKDKGGAPFNYMVAAFEEPAKQRFELNFVRIALAPKNAFILVYGARVPHIKEFLDQHAAEIGRSLENAVLPDLATMPRKEF